MVREDILFLLIVFGSFIVLRTSGDVGDFRATGPGGVPWRPSLQVKDGPASAIQKCGIRDGLSHVVRPVPHGAQERPWARYERPEQRSCPWVFLQQARATCGARSRSMASRTGSR